MIGKSLNQDKMSWLIFYRLFLIPKPSTLGFRFFLPRDLQVSNCYDLDKLFFGVHASDPEAYIYCFTTLLLSITQCVL